MLERFGVEVVCYDYYTGAPFKCLNLINSLSGQVIGVNHDDALAFRVRVTDQFAWRGADMLELVFHCSSNVGLKPVRSTIDQKCVGKNMIFSRFLSFNEEREMWESVSINFHALEAVGLTEKSDAAAPENYGFATLKVRRCINAGPELPFEKVTFDPIPRSKAPRSECEFRLQIGDRTSCSAPLPEKREPLQGTDGNWISFKFQIRSKRWLEVQPYSGESDSGDLQGSSQVREKDYLTKDTPYRGTARSPPKTKIGMETAKSPRAKALFPHASDPMTKKPQMRADPSKKRSRSSTGDRPQKISRSKHAEDSTGRQQRRSFAGELDRQESDAGLIGSANRGITAQGRARPRNLQREEPTIGGPLQLGNRTQNRDLVLKNEGTEQDDDYIERYRSLSLRPVAGPQAHEGGDEEPESFTNNADEETIVLRTPDARASGHSATSSRALFVVEEEQQTHEPTPDKQEVDRKLKEIDAEMLDIARTQMEILQRQRERTLAKQRALAQKKDQSLGPN